MTEPHILLALLALTVQAASPSAQAPPGGSNALLTAKTVLVAGEAGKHTTNRDVWNPNASRASLKAEEVMREWRRYKVVFRTEDADLVMVVTESHQDFGPQKLARLVAELKVYPGRQERTINTPALWSGQAVETGVRQPSARVAEMFRDYVRKLAKP